jgi:hypothetical protein
VLIQKQMMGKTSTASFDRKLTELQAGAAAKIQEQSHTHVDDIECLQCNL